MYICLYTCMCLHAHKSTCMYTHTHVYYTYLHTHAPVTTTNRIKICEFEREHGGIYERGWKGKGK